MNWVGGVCVPALLIPCISLAADKPLACVLSNEIDWNINLPALLFLAKLPDTLSADSVYGRAF